MTTREDEMAFVKHLRRKAKATEDIGDSTDFVDAADRLTTLSSERDLLVEALESIRDAVSKRQLPITNQVYEIADAALTGVTGG
jgi:hypothetical protein